MQTYIGVKMIQAERQKHNNKPGYKVVYQPDGYTSWSPKDVFEAAYFPLANGEESKISQEDVEGLMEMFHVYTLGEKTTVVRATLRNGFEMVESSSCVDPANYDEALGADLCTTKIKGHVWGLLGFVLQWAKSGLKAKG